MAAKIFVHMCPMCYRKTRDPRGCAKCRAKKG